MNALLKLHQNQQGSHVLPVLVMLATLAIIIFVGYTVFTKNRDLKNTDSGHASVQLP